MTGTLRLVITGTRGSTPRETGAAMEVGTRHQTGTIGGGRLEWEAVAWARRLLRQGQVEGERRFVLGPDLGQCCGGVVDLRAEPVAPTARTGPNLWVWGAGHVGRAVVDVMAPVPQWQITWADTAADRFPAKVSDGVTTIPTADLPRLARNAPLAAHHLILTYSHEIDLMLCDALLRRGFSSAGLIGSATKWARFRKRLADMGHQGDEISRIACPIGNRALGKHPQAIAIGVAGSLISLAGASGGDGGHV